MAGNENSGGFRPDAPQNNPANVSALGGNGQSGQAMGDYTGFAYGENKALAEQQMGAKMAQASTGAQPTSAGSMMDLLSSIPSLDADSEDDLPISDGVDVGRGRGSEALPTRVTSDINQAETIDLIKKYLPSIMDATRFPGAPDSYKRFANYLKANIL
jgi:hypothetical protein